MSIFYHDELIKETYVRIYAMSYIFQACRERCIPAGKQGCQRVYLQRAEVLSPPAKAFGGRRPRGTAACAEAAVPLSRSVARLVYLNNRIRMMTSAVTAARARISSVTYRGYDIFGSEFIRDLLRRD